MSWLCFGDLHLIFKVTPGQLAKFMPKVAFMHNILCTCWQILARFACIYCDMKRWIGFGDIDLIFKVTPALKLLSLESWNFGFSK